MNEGASEAESRLRRALPWSPKPVIRAVLKWIHGIVRGDEKKNQVRYRTKFIESGTIGPARARKI